MHSIDDLVEIWMTLILVSMDILINLLVFLKVCGVGERNLEGRMLLELCMSKELCVVDTWFEREGRRKVAFRLGESETEIHLVLIQKETGYFHKI